MKAINLQNKKLLDYQETLLQRNKDLMESSDAIKITAFEMNVLYEKPIQSENELKKSNVKLK